MYGFRWRNSTRNTQEQNDNFHMRKRCLFCCSSILGKNENNNNNNNTNNAKVSSTVNQFDDSKTPLFKEILSAVNDLSVFMLSKTAEQRLLRFVF